MTTIYALTVLKVLWKTTSMTQIQVFIKCFVDADDCRKLPFETIHDEHVIQAQSPKCKNVDSIC